MDAIRSFRRLIDYDVWANREALASLNSVPAPAERPLKFLAHILGAQRIWLARLGHTDFDPNAVWPSLTQDDCRPAINDLQNRWAGILDKLTPERLDENIRYRNTKGLEFDTPLQDILVHVVMHSAYHPSRAARHGSSRRSRHAGGDGLYCVRPPNRANRSQFESEGSGHNEADH